MLNGPIDYNLYLDKTMDNLTNEERLIVIEKDIGSIAGNFKDMKEDQEEFISLMRKTLFGNGEKEGLVSMVVANRKWIEKREWLEKVVLGALAVQFITLLVLVFQQVKIP